MPNSYIVGQLVRCTATFKNSSDVNTDPTAVLVKYKTPTTIVTKTYGIDAEVVKSATGIYYIDLTLNEEGTWTYRFEGTGAVVAAGETWLQVGDSAFY